MHTTARRDDRLPTSRIPAEAEVLVVGAGPAGSAAATWAARAGHDVLLLDAARFPRDKTCGDGLTPRALGELDRLGLGGWARTQAVNKGLRLKGFGRQLEMPWPGGAFPAEGSAVPRSVLDDRIRAGAVDAGARMLGGARIIGVDRAPDGRVRSVRVRDDERGRERTDGVDVRCRTLIVADGVRSPVGRMLGRRWHRETAYGVAARAYIGSGRHDDPWISSHLELRDPDGALLSGYGWLFPLGDGRVNIGVGTLATAARPAKGALRPLLDHYVRCRRDDWDLHGDPAAPASALLPMGGAVSGVAGPNWALVGDAAACVNPLNGEGIDYGLEGGRLLVELLSGDGPGSGLTRSWPTLLSAHYGDAFSVARRLAGLLTVPRVLPAGGPVAMRSRRLMEVAVRVMGNLVTDEDADVVARAWRAAGRASLRTDQRAPFAD
ncbi:geranylgeranyl reductase family protein [Tomitella gaofuii]|uniref:geranylgeranyl reductase family protein n=1 Tax=Tomitella gaofuii TaxID=2760083 RepID=UPI0015F81509|nr:geranylgeranyl reductase family protein [Tomitella gaofuii]